MHIGGIMQYLCIRLQYYTYNCLAVAAVNEFRCTRRERNKEYASDNDAGIFGTIYESDGDTTRCVIAAYVSFDILLIASV